MGEPRRTGAPLTEEGRRLADSDENLRPWVLAIEEEAGVLALRFAREARSPAREGLREAIEKLPRLRRAFAEFVRLEDVRAALSTPDPAPAAALDVDALRDAYITALATAWEQANAIAAGETRNTTAIVSNIEERFKPFIPHWREASAEAARRSFHEDPAWNLRPARLSTTPSQDPPETT